MKRDLFYRRNNHHRQIERHYYTIAFFQVFNVFTGFNYFTHKLMAKNIAGFHGWHTKVGVSEKNDPAVDRASGNIWPSS